MIPTIEQIIADLIAGTMKIDIANRFMNEHVRLARQARQDNAQDSDLRDLFAMEAMKITLATPDANQEWTPKKVGMVCYMIADGMMEARKNG